MRASKVTCATAGLLVLAAVVGLASAGAAQTVSVMTNSGDVVQGVLSGLAPVLRLEDPVPHVGPAAQFDIPLSTIQQMWVDFPRIVIETTDHVLVGPFSAFAGIAQLLKIEQVGKLTQIPFTAIRQIAFEGQGFRPVPREWLGQRWLNQRVYVATKSNLSASPSAVDSAPAAVAPTPAVSESDEIVWDGTVPEEAAPSTSSGELPWWVVFVALAVLVGAFLLIPSG